MDGQPRIIDLVPKSYWKLGLLFVAGLSVIAGLGALYHYMPRLAAHTSDGTIAAFDLDCEGSLGTWFSSVMLGMTALVCWLVFSVRRHKADDYHGRYRLWLWAGLVFLVMSIDEAASLHEGFKEMMSLVAGTRIIGDGSLWWVLGYSLVLLPLGIRLAFQIFHCRTATVAYVLGAAALGAAVATQLEWILPQSGALGILVEEALEMLGYLLLLTGSTLFARYVILESQGLLGAKAAKTAKRQKRDSAAATGSGSKPGDVATGTATRPSASISAASTSAQTRIDSAHGSEQRRLSKAERRAQRKQHQLDRD